jgi:cycloartenol synthase
MQEDVYNPHTWLQECLSDCLYSFGEPFLTRWPVSYMRKKALQQIAEFLKYEDENSQYICIGAAQKVRLLCLLNTRDSQQLTFDITAETSPSFE